MKAWSWFAREWPAVMFAVLLVLGVFGLLGKWSAYSKASRECKDRGVVVNDAAGWPVCIPFEGFKP